MKNTICSPQAVWRALGSYHLELVRHPPWRTSDDDLNIDGEMPEIVKAAAAKKEHDDIPENISVPNRVKKEDFEQYGFASKCLGRRSILTKSTWRARSDACRKRMETSKVAPPQHSTENRPGNSREYASATCSMS